MQILASPLKRPFPVVAGLHETPCSTVILKYTLYLFNKIKLCFLCSQTMLLQYIKRVQNKARLPESETGS